MSTESGTSRFDRRLRGARAATLALLAPSVLMSPTMPTVGLFLETRPLWVVLGAIGIVIFAVAHLGAVYATVTPWLADTVRRGLLRGFAAAAAVSIPLVGPAGAGHWQTWAWVGAAIIGLVPLPGQWRLAAAIITVTLAAAAGVAWWTGGSVADYLLIAASAGLVNAFLGGLTVWLWDLLVSAEEGRAAQARLAATEERLRFAGDVHDLLGHSLSVIALKAELAARLAATDADRAGQEAGEVQRLASGALSEMREVVHGYRAVNLRDQLSAVEEVLRSSEVRCTVTQPDGELPQHVVSRLLPVLREASTNVLRHSKADWCTIDLTAGREEVRMTIVNDGALGAGPDRHSFGLRGLSDRLRDGGGALRTEEGDGVFMLEAIVRVKP